jgi:hypothetical protein
MGPDEDGLDNYKRIIINTGTITAIYGEEERRIQGVLREREINNALKEGSHVCMLCNDTDDLLFKQVLSSNSIQFIKSINHISQMKVHRSEFSDFLNRYGTAFGIFSRDKSFDSVICTTSQVHVSALLFQEDILMHKNDGYILGFTLKKDLGLLTFLPFYISSARYNYEKKSDEILSKLIASLDTHRKNIVSEQPNWTNEVKNKLEVDLEEKIRAANVKLEPKLNLLKRQCYLKSILWTKYDELRDACVKAFEEIGIKAIENDIGIEDFYLQSNSSSNICICEAKGKDNDLLLGDLSKFEINRERAGENESFPSLLIANTHNKANTLEEKDRPIPSNVIEKAKRDNILIMRSLDLFRLIGMFQEKKINTKEILKMILGSQGWVQVEEGIKIKTK